MKVTLHVYYLLLILCCFFTGAIAQTDQKAGFTIGLADQSNNSVFDANPDLAYLYITYTKAKIPRVSIYHKNESEARFIAKLSQSFEGDRYQLKHKYPQLKLPAYPKLNMWLLDGVKNLRDSTNYYSTTTKIVRDSVIHTFSVHIKTEGVYKYVSAMDENLLIISKVRDANGEVSGADTVYTLHPQPKGGIQQYQKKLTEKYKLWKPLSIKDSALLISGLVERDGSMGNIKLILGEPSPFSDKVLEFINQEIKSWWPRSLSSMRKIKDATRIFVRLNKDDSFTLSNL